MTKKVFIAVALFAAACQATRADVVIDWNKQLLGAIRTGTVNPPMASRAMAITHLAIYDAVNSIEDTHKPYAVNLNVPATTSREAAAAQAARDALVGLFPAQAATFDAALSTSLAGIPDGQAKTDGINLGSQVAASILALRANDHSKDVVAYVPSGQVGDWEPTPPANAAALLPNWPTVTPFAMTSGSQFRNLTGPPALTSAEYATALNEVKEIGSSTSATRTAEQTSVARFWADGGGTSTPPGHWNRIAQDVAVAQGNDIAENARLFAMLNVATADSAISCWDAKYAYDMWRPVTAIRKADQDGNPATTADANWTSLIPTPPFPTYTSGHSTFSGASATILAEFFGTDNISFTTSSEGFIEPNRSFTSFSQAADEAAMSRLYGGIHFSFDNQDGLDAGVALGNYVAANYFTAVPEPSSALLVVLGLLGIRRLKRS